MIGLILSLTELLHLGWWSGVLSLPLLTLLLIGSRLSRYQYYAALLISLMIDRAILPMPQIGWLLLGYLVVASNYSFRKDQHLFWVTIVLSQTCYVLSISAGLFSTNRILVVTRVGIELALSLPIAAIGRLKQGTNEAKAV